MVCPHCHVNFHADNRTDFDYISDSHMRIFFVGEDAESHWWIEKVACPACRRLIIWLVNSDGFVDGDYPHRSHRLPDDTEHAVLVRPKVANRSPISPEVPDEFAKDYSEACLILADSPNASAALSRRCLQLILREKLGAQGTNLYQEIQWAIEQGNLPSSVVDLLNVPRKVGNKAAHPSLSDASLIVDVEPWEAEWCLEIIEALYDHVFVLPSKNRERLERLEQQQSSRGTGNPG